MPRVFRIMKQDADGSPTLGLSNLGVRPGIDVEVDAQGNVLVNGKGMSVAPDWRDIVPSRIPKRLRAIVPGAAAGNSFSCFCIGEGPFQRGDLAKGLVLEPDSAIHGVVVPAVVVPFAEYEADLAATRPDWQVDET